MDVGGWLSSWWAFSGVVVVLTAVVVLTFRSLARWNQTPPNDEETRQAEARLWSTRNIDA